MSNRNGHNDPRSLRRLMFFYAAGEPNSITATENLRRICEAASDCECEIERVDVLEDFRTALEYGVLVTPCVILLEPLPRSMVVGTLKDTERVRTALRLRMEDSL